ncbi:MAG: aspartate/glutamate racemase family protein [Chloroflexota bacterium]|nr:aspartate/glutamate racemase family protein [Dehalococcoidia bacterium]MDW8254383.1 aspartate/glutamate racemase family protein [Chloroflexota bacterium]
MRIWYQYPGPVSPFREGVVFGSVMAILDRVRRPDTDVTIVPTARGITNWSDWWTDYVRTISDREIVETVAGAGEAGYDGVIIGMSSDPGLHEAKEILDIPVVGLMEAATHFATIWGERFGIVTNAFDEGVPLAKRYRHRRHLLARYGVLDRCVGMLPIDMPQQRYLADLAERRHDEILTRFEQRSRQLIDQGAEVIIAGDTVLSMAVSGANLFEIPGTGAPVVDLMASAIKLIEALVDLHRAFGIVRSRAGAYAGPSKETLARVREMFGLRQADRAQAEGSAGAA